MQRRKAPYVKQAIFQAARKLQSENKDVDTTALVAKLRSEYSKAIDRDKEDILDFGLRVLAGRITTMRSGKETDQDMFDKEGLVEYFPLRKLLNSRVKRISVSTRTLTPRMIDEQPDAKSAPQPKDNKVLGHLQEMRRLGLMDKTLETYLAERG